MSVTNFARQIRYIGPGKTAQPISVPPTIEIQNEAQTGDFDVDQDSGAENSDDEEVNEEEDPPANEITGNNVPGDAQEEQREENNDDEEINEDEEEIRAEEENDGQDFNMAEVLGQTSGQTFNFLSGTQNEIERQVRDIVYPSVEIVVNFIL